MDRILIEEMTGKWAIVWHQSRRA